MKRSWMVAAAVILAVAGLAMAGGSGKHKGHKAVKSGHVAKTTSSHKAQTHAAKAGKASVQNRHGKATATVHKGRTKASAHASARTARHTGHKAHHAATVSPAHKTKANSVRVQRDIPSRSIVDAPVQPDKARTVTAVAKNKPTADLKSAQLAMTGERLIPLGNW